MKQNSSKGKEPSYSARGSHGSTQLTAMNNQTEVPPLLYHADQASSSNSQATWTTGDQQNFVPDDLLAAFARKLWMNKDNMY